MKRTLVGVLLVALWSSQAHADERERWRVMLAASITVTVSGGVLVFYGHDKLTDAQDEICKRGGYPFDPACERNPVTLTEDEVRRLNEKGDRGAQLSYIGWGTTMVGAGFAAFATYKLLTAKSEPEPAVAFTPVVSSDGAGAQLLLRW